MDDGLVPSLFYQFQTYYKVLILVVVDDGLVPSLFYQFQTYYKVLILVVVDDGLVQIMKISVGKNGTVS